MQRSSNNATSDELDLDGSPLRIRILRRPAYRIFFRRRTPKSPGSRFKRLVHGLVINPEKCLFGQTSLNFLGHLITKDGIKPLESKIEAIVNIPLPQTNKQLKGFIASVNFYRRFIQNAIDSQRILNALVEGNIKNDKRPVSWTEEARQAFNHCKQQLQNAAMFAYPSPDAQLSMQVDASDWLKLRQVTTAGATAQHVQSFA